MKLLRHGVASLVLFSMFVMLFVSTYSDMQQVYEFTPDQVKDLTGTVGDNNYTLTSGNIMEQFNNMKLIEGMNDLNKGIVKLTSGSVTDLLGGLTAAGVGFAKLVVGIITAPSAILEIITIYYGGAILPQAFIKGLSAIVSVYVLFILLSKFTRDET